MAVNAIFRLEIPNFAAHAPAQHTCFYAHWWLCVAHPVFFGGLVATKRI